MVWGRVQRVLINRNYALFMGGSFVSALGSWFQSVALGWLVLELSNSPFVLGLVNFALMAPLFFLGFAGGVLADRVERRTLLLVGMGWSTLAIGLLAVLALRGQASVPAILVISLFIGLTQAIVWPAWQPFIKDLVPAERLREAIAFNSARFNLTRVLGASAGRDHHGACRGASLPRRGGAQRSRRLDRHLAHPPAYLSGVGAPRRGSRPSARA